MDFQYFQYLAEEKQFDEIRVIGKDIKIKGLFYHMIGMTRKEKQVVLHILEQRTFLAEEEFFCIQTQRERKKEQINSRKEEPLFLNVREFQSEEASFPVSGVISAGMNGSQLWEEFLLFLEFHKEGWRIPESSPFYKMEWASMKLTEVEFLEEYNVLPQWQDGIKMFLHPKVEEELLEIPVKLTCGQTQEIIFTLPKKKEAVCYINRVYLMDVWEEQEEKFSSLEYRDRVLQHMSEEELEKMIESFNKTLEEHCKKGSRYMVVEYECSEDLQLTFYDKDNLDMVEKPREGSASTVFIGAKPDREVGDHGLKLRSCVIQKELTEDATMLEAELFSYIKTGKKRTVKL